MSKKLQREIEAIVAQLPRKFVKDLIREKLVEAGLEPKEALLEQLTAHVLSGGKDEVTWEESGEKDFTLTFTDEDLDSIDRKLTAFTEKKLPKLVEEVTETGARELLKTLRRNWPDRDLWEKQARRTFEERLEQRWAEPLALLRMLLTISREIGEERSAKLARSRAKRNRHRNEVLCRLHARACQVSEEIVHLLAGGFADGAMARWRTLHEIGVVVALIAEHGDELAETYLAHEAVESKRGLHTYMATYEQLGYKPLSKREIKRVEKSLADGIAKYGTQFKNEYGWAAKILKNPNPRFAYLEAAAGRARMRSHYKMASHNVHAGVKGITHRLGLLAGSRIMLAGASNAGLDEPGQNTAITLTQITFALFGPRWPIDDLVMLKAISGLRDKAVQAFVRTGRRLDREGKAQP
ncbi:DUF5677 domain-containing protein [Luteimonas sp. XNQY3]|nr:DUF5677 domain-containing protein [Luteimonas sp. XNQY3]MCD9007694.1 DUF5677 domain-containing protein [Luteimonas sp. XNQY3]